MYCTKRDNQFLMISRGYMNLIIRTTILSFPTSPPRKYLWIGWVYTNAIMLSIMLVTASWDLQSAC